MTRAACGVPVIVLALGCGAPTSVSGGLSAVRGRTQTGAPGRGFSPYASRIPPAWSPASTDPSEEIRPLLPWRPVGSTTLSGRRGPAGTSHGEDGEPGPDRGAFGVRAALVLSERADWRPSGRVAVSFERRAWDNGRLRLGIEYGREHSPGAGGEVPLLRMAAGLGLFAFGGEESRLRIVYGAALAYDVIELPEGAGALAGSAFMARVGLELGPPHGRWDATLGISAFVSTGGAQSEASLSVGVDF